MGISRSYRISTQTFTSEFLKVLQLSDAFTEDPDGDSRVFRRFIRQIYFTVARTIAKSEYTELGLLICKSAYPELVPVSKWEPFITNFMAAGDPVSVPEWLRNKETSSKVASFASQLPALYATLNLNDQRLWHDFMTSGHAAGSATDEVHFPVQLSSEFDKVLIVQMLRPDLLLPVLQAVVTRLLGFNYMAVVQPSVQQLGAESANGKPVLILSVPGTDPSRELRELAQGGLQGGYTELSVAQGQERETLQSVRQAAKDGHWICLKNIHLLPLLIRDLEAELAAVQAEGGTHPDFRLWIICESLSGFSETFLMKSISVLFELPNGLKLKVQRLLRMWESSLASEGGKLLRIAFALFLFTGILQERRNFIPQGFTQWYDFADADLRVAIDFVRMLMARQRGGGGGGDSLEWNFVQKIIEVVAFGGRLNNEQDLKVLLAHVRSFFNQHLLSPSWNVLPLLRDVFSARHSLPAATQATRPSDYHEYLDNAFGEAANVDPQNFGLPKNARAMKNVQVCRQLLRQLRSVHVAAGTTKQAELGERQRRLKPILSLWKSLSQVRGG